MKKTGLLVLLIGLIPLSSHAEAAKNIISIHPISLFLGEYEIDYERVISPKFTATARIAKWDAEIDDWGLNLFSLGAAANYYFAKNAPKGLYAQIGFDYMDLTATYTNVSVSQGITRTNGTFGYNLPLRRVAMNLSLGASYYKSDIQILGQELPITGLLPDLSFAIGIQF